MNDETIILCPACNIYRADYLEWGENGFICPNCKVRHGRNRIKGLEGNEHIGRTKRENKFFVWDNGRVKLIFGGHTGEYLDAVPSHYIGWLVREHSDGKSSFTEDFILECEEELRVRGELDKYV